MNIEVKKFDNDELTIVNVTGDSQCVKEMSFDIRENGASWAIIAWNKGSVWEYMLPSANSTLIHLLSTKSMGKTAHHIKRVAVEARQL